MREVKRIKVKSGIQRDSDWHQRVVILRDKNYQKYYCPFEEYPEGGFSGLRLKFEWEKIKGLKTRRAFNVIKEAVA